MKAWDMLLVSGRPHALVLEDDARVPPNLAELVDKMMGVLPERWDLVHLYDHDCHPSRPLRAVGNEHELVRYSRVPGGCVGYLLSRSGAQKLLRQELRCWPLDTDFRRPWHFLLDSDQAPAGSSRQRLRLGNPKERSSITQAPRHRVLKPAALPAGGGVEPAEARNSLVGVLSRDQQLAAVFEGRGQAVVGGASAPRISSRENRASRERGEERARQSECRRKGRRSS
jgi:hypothetical protein